MTPTHTQINELIAARNHLTDRRDELIDLDAVDHIDNLLRDVPAGQRNDVDLLLGRSCAVLPKRKSEVKRAYFVNPAVTLELDPVCSALLAQHNVDVDERKERGEGRQGKTFTSLLEQAQREGKVNQR